MFASFIPFNQRKGEHYRYPPAVREICEAVHLKSTSSVHSHLETLEKNGYIRRDPTKPRAIEIVDDDFNLVRREIVNVPLIGSVAAGEPIFAEQNIEGYFPLLADDMPSGEGREYDQCRHLRWRSYYRT